MPTDPHSLATEAHTLGAEESRPAPAAAFYPVASAAGTTTATSDRDSGRGSVASSAAESGSHSPALAGELDSTASPGDLSMLDITINQRPDRDLIKREYTSRTDVQVGKMEDIINEVCVETLDQETVAGQMPDGELVNGKVRERIADKVFAAMEFKGFFSKNFTLTQQTAPLWIEGVIHLISQEVLSTIFDKARLARFTGRGLGERVIPMVREELLARNKEAVLNESIIQTSKSSHTDILSDLRNLLLECTQLKINSSGNFELADTELHRKQKTEGNTEGFYVSKKQIDRFIRKKSQEAESSMGSEASFRLK